MPAQTQRDPGEDEEPPNPETPGDAGPDAHVGAVEGDRPQDPQHYNSNVPALDEEGMPGNAVKICEDVLGANEDESSG